MTPIETRSNQKHATTSMVERLPSEVMVQVLEFLELPAKVRFANLNKLLMRRVHQECCQLWAEVDIGGTAKMKAYLTDELLAKFLTRIDAKNVTKSLNLEACSAIHGIGLLPLRCSRKLERINLRKSCPQLQDKKTCVDILKTMIPYKLTEVRFLEEMPVPLDAADCCRKISPGDLVAMEFMRELRAAKEDQARNEMLVCSTCIHTVTAARKQMPIDFVGKPLLQCTMCQGLFCRGPACPTGVADCKACGEAFCNDCTKMDKCMECACSFCKQCDSLSSCDNCTGKFCRHCIAVVKCSGCKKKLCENCNDQQDSYIRMCLECELYLCHDCKHVDICDDCVEGKCGCCSKVKRCDRCKGHFCAYCRDVNYLPCCGETLCSECFPPVKCASCSEMRCMFHVETCLSCEQSYCGPCRARLVCGTCDGKPPKKVKVTHT